MFEHDPREATELTQYTGLKIGAILLPMLLLFIYFGKADMGLTLYIVLAASIVAIKIRWNLRKHLWFWLIIVFIFALHVPLFLIIRWPNGKTPGLFLWNAIRTRRFSDHLREFEARRKVLLQALFFLRGMTRIRIVGLAHPLRSVS